MKDSKLYIAVLDEFPDYMTPTLVAHTVLGYDRFAREADRDSFRIQYFAYLETSFKKVVVRVNQKEFDKISALDYVYLGYENKTLDGKNSCAVWLYNGLEDVLPNVLKYAKLWKPNEVIGNLDTRQSCGII